MNLNRALRKRASKLRGKALKQLSKRSSGSDLATLSQKLSLEQYEKVLAHFEKPKEENLSTLAVRLMEDLFRSTEALESEHIEALVPESKARRIDCCAGCAWCCHEPIQCSILDAISVAHHLLNTDKAEEFSPTLDAYLATIAPYENRREQLKQSFDPCPFLGTNHQCKVYQARPIICRAFHSTDVGVCTSIHEQKAAERSVPMYTGLFGFRGIRLSGARQALSELGMDDRPVVLAKAVKLLLDDFDSVTESWLQGGDSFETAAVR